MNCIHCLGSGVLRFGRCESCNGSGMAPDKPHEEHIWADDPKVKVWIGDQQVDPKELTRRWNACQAAEEEVARIRAELAESKLQQDFNWSEREKWKSYCVETARELHYGSAYPTVEGKPPSEPTMPRYENMALHGAKPLYEEAQKLRELNAEMGEMLKRHEFNMQGDLPYGDCMECDHKLSHAPDCALAALLAKVGRGGK